MKTFLLVLGLLWAGCSKPVAPGGKLVERVEGFVAPDLQVRTITIDGNTYLMQWVSNGHFRYWLIVAGPLPPLKPSNPSL